MLGPEPTLIIQAVVAMLVAANTALTTTNALPLPAWVSTVISIVLVGLGALVNRSQVSPKAKPAPTPDSSGGGVVMVPVTDLELGPEPMPENLNPDEWLANRQPEASS